MRNFKTIEFAKTDFNNCFHCARFGAYGHQETGIQGIFDQKKLCAQYFIGEATNAKGVVWHSAETTQQPNLSQIPPWSGTLDGVHFQLIHLLSNLAAMTGVRHFDTC